MQSAVLISKINALFSFNCNFAKDRDGPRFEMGSSHPPKTFKPLRRAHPKAEEKENGREDQGGRIVLSRRSPSLFLD